MTSVYHLPPPGCPQSFAAVLSVSQDCHIPLLQRPPSSSSRRRRAYFFVPTPRHQKNRCFLLPRKMPLDTRFNSFPSPRDFSGLMFHRAGNGCRLWDVIPLQPLRLGGSWRSLSAKNDTARSRPSFFPDALHVLRALARRMK